MDYTPKSTTPQPSPTTYELTKDVTGSPPEQRGDYVLTDKAGTQVKFPHHPKKNCKKCYGRGYLGMNIKNGRFVICHKCYSKI
jgi:hypothetical protein